MMPLPFTFIHSNKNMMNRIAIKTVIFLLCTLILTLLLCKAHADWQQELKEKRFRAGERVEAMMHSRDFMHLYPYLDTMHKEYPNDPLFYVAEGMARDFQGDKRQARKAFEKAVEIYDLRIATKHDLGDMVNRAGVIQSLYGKAAFYQAIDEAISHASSRQEAERIECFRSIDFKETQRQMFCKDHP